MKIGIYDPYLDSLGGGEKYMLTIGTCLSKEHDVSIFWDKREVLDQVYDRFGIDTTHITCVPNLFSVNTSLFSRILQLNKYDAIFYLSDGSIPFLSTKKNFLFFQLPINWINGKTLINKLKFAKFNQVICNSEFVKSFIDRSYGIKSEVLTPPINPISKSSVKKEQIILTVGRFTKGNNRKKQQELINAFKKLYDDGFKEWKFVLIGGAFLSEEKEFVHELKDTIGKYPITIYENAAWKDVVLFYQKAMIYWHGTGFGENILQHPERAEHFGISIVEAMSTGCVPVVFNGGGQKEIIENTKNGFLWNNEKELISITKHLIQDRFLYKEVTRETKKRIKQFSEERFCEQVTRLVEQ